MLYCPFITKPSSVISSRWVLMIVKTGQGFAQLGAVTWAGQPSECHWTQGVVTCAVQPSECHWTLPGAGWGLQDGLTTRHNTLQFVP